MARKNKKRVWHNYARIRNDGKAIIPNAAFTRSVDETSRKRVHDGSVYAWKIIARANENGGSGVDAISVKIEKTLAVLGDTVAFDYNAHARTDADHVSVVME